MVSVIASAAVEVARSLTRLTPHPERRQVCQLRVAVRVYGIRRIFPPKLESRCAPDVIRKLGTFFYSTTRIPVFFSHSNNYFFHRRGPFVTALGKIWCPEHFVCSRVNCGRSLLEIGFVEEPSGFYCEYCFEQYLAPTCAQCSNKIKGVRERIQLEKVKHDSIFQFVFFVRRIAWTLLVNISIRTVSPARFAVNTSAIVLSFWKMVCRTAKKVNCVPQWKIISRTNQH